MSTQKRGLASTSSGQASLLKRPRIARMNQTWGRSGSYLMRRSWLTEEDVRRVVSEELERAKAHSVENWQSCNGNALEDIMQQISSMKNAVQKLTEIVELANIHSPHLGRVNARSMGINDVRNLWLQFQNKLSDPLFTGRKLRGDRGACISVALIDVNTGDVVTSGPESSLKLDIVVLEGDFNRDDADNWAHEEFENYVVKEREQKGLLLTGDLQVTLKGGVGELGDLIFTDNSSWNRSKRFRIGLKVASGYCGNTRIREAKTDAFRVKEHRGESSKKHDIPAFDDEIWRLKMIAKDGKYHQKLSEAGIHEVGDFLLQLFLDPMKLKEILGMSSNSTNWDTLENHAKSCKTHWKLYLYYTDGMGKHGAVFNTDRQLIGLIKDSVYCATRQFSDDDKEHGDTIVKMALDNWKDVREFNGGSFSDSMQKNSSTSFPCQVSEGQIENLNPFQRNLALRICAAPVGPEAFPANAGSTAEVIRTVNENVPRSEPPSAAISSFQSSSTLPPSEGNHVMKDLQPTVSDDNLDYWLALFSQSPPHDDKFCKTPLYDGGSVRGTSKGVNGWIKIKAVMQWGIFIRKIVTKKRARMLQFYEPPIEVQT